RHFLHTSLAIALLLAAGVPAQADERTDSIVYHYYKQYLQRRPTPREVRSWAGQVEAGTMTLQQVQARLLSSAEYYRMHESRPGPWVRGLYEDVLGREPNRDEVRTWVNAFVDSG